MIFKRDRQSDQRRYNEPTSNEVAMVFVNEDGESPFHRDIRIYSFIKYWLWTVFDELVMDCMMSYSLLSPMR